MGKPRFLATALANQFVNIYQICCMGIAMGASVLTSRFWGMQDITSLKKTITLILGLVVGILGGGLIKVLSRPIIGLYSHGGRYYFSVGCVIAPWNSGGAGMASGCFLDLCFSEK